MNRVFIMPPLLTLYLYGGIALDAVVKADLPGLCHGTVDGCQINSWFPL